MNIIGIMEDVCTMTCPLCAKPFGSYFFDSSTHWFGSISTAKNGGSTRFHTIFRVNDTGFERIRRVRRWKSPSLWLKNAPECAMCGNCKGIIRLPHYRSKDWSNPLRCVFLAFARAKAMRHARHRIQEVVL